MRLQIRNSVFETNSSSTHAMTYYSKKEWQDFQDGKTIMVDHYLGTLKTKEECYEDYLKDENSSWGNHNPTPEGFESWLEDNTFTWSSFEEQYEVLTCEPPGCDDYIVISIYGYE